VQAALQHATNVCQLHAALVKDAPESGGFFVNFAPGE
jgi:hypothetical protein